MPGVIVIAICPRALRLCPPCRWAARGSDPPPSKAGIGKPIL